MNYLNPHSLPRNGKNLLYKLLSPAAGPTEILPTVLALSKDKALMGDIIVAVTDGVYSYDQVRMGKDDRQMIWIDSEPSMALLYQHLKVFFEGTYSEDALEPCLRRFLNELSASSLVSDDCTVAVLITEKALKYQQELRSERVEEVEL